MYDKGPSHEAVLEITGTRAPQFGENKLRQLLDWIHRGVELRKKRYKGLFIGVAAIDRPPAERPNPFSPSWATSAQLHSIAALRGEDVYRAVCSLEEGEFESQKEAFWRAVLETDGIVDVASILGAEERSAAAENVSTG